VITQGDINTAIQTSLPNTLGDFLGKCGCK